MPTSTSSNLSLPASSKDSQDTKDTSPEEPLGSPIAVPDSGDHGESGKLKMIVQLVKRSLGVKDLASMSVVLVLRSVDLPRRHPTLMG